MAKNITWTPPYGKVNNLTATLQPGGNLAPNTTYYFRVYPTNTSGTIQGEVSDEVSVTTTTTDLSVKLDWDLVADDPYYAVCKTTTSGYYVGIDKMVRGAVGNYYYTVDNATNTYTVTGSESTYYPLHKFSLVEDLPAGLNKDLGCGLLKFNGGSTSDPITFEDFYNAVGDETYCKFDGTNFYLLGYAVRAGGEAYFLSLEENAWLFHFYDDNYASDGYFQFGQIVETGAYKGVVTDTCTLQLVPHTFVRPSLRSNRFRFYGTRILGAGRWSQSGAASFFGWRTYEDGATFKDVQLENSIIANADFTFTGKVASVEMGSDIDYVNLTDLFITKNPLDHSYLLDGLSRTSASIRNVRLATPNYVRFLATSPGDGVSLINFTIDGTDDNLPNVTWYSPTYTPYPDVWMKYTLDLKVVDDNGDAIEGAVIKIVDSDGTEVTNTTTDLSGVIPTQDLVKVKMNMKPDSPARPTGPDYTVYVYKTPHTLTISAPGYQTYTSELDMSSKKDLVITLNKQVDVFKDDNADLYINPKPSDPTSDLVVKI